jgi:hypothetical protein
MIEKQCALDIKDHALKAITELTQLLNTSQGRCSQEEYERIKKGIGLSIGKIQTDVLDVVYAVHPELNDLS